MNEAQQVYKMMNIDIGFHTPSVSFTTTKTGSGRTHMDGYPSFKTRERQRKYLLLAERLAQMKALQAQQSAV